MTQRSGKGEGRERDSEGDHCVPVSGAPVTLEWDSRRDPGLVTTELVSSGRGQTFKLALTSLKTPDGCPWLQHGLGLPNTGENLILACKQFLVILECLEVSEPQTPSIHILKNCHASTIKSLVHDPPNSWSWSQGTKQDPGLERWLISPCKHEDWSYDPRTYVNAEQPWLPTWNATTEEVTGSLERAV